MNHRPASGPSSSRAAAFTLIELLTVIAIIAILMALLFPAIMSAKEAARRAQALNDVQQIVAAVKSYNTEYGRYPDIATAAAPAGGGVPADVMVGDSTLPNVAGNNNLLFYTLRSINILPNTDYTMNPRRVVFFEGKQATNATAPKAGFQVGGANAATNDSYFDPWGKQYNIVMDTNYDNVLDTPYTDFASPNQPRFGVGAFSLGKDNFLGKNNDKAYKTGTVKSDDIISWQ